MRAGAFVFGFVAVAVAGGALAQDAPADGEKLFVEKCGMCHREADRVAGMGTFLIARRDPANDPMLERRKVLTPEYIHTAVRAGIINMPRISRAEVSDAQLDAIAAYLVGSAANYVPASAPAGEADPIQ